MSFPVFLFIAFVVIWLSIHVLKKAQRRRQERFIADYPFPPSIMAKVGERYPHLNDVQINRVIAGLRDYFQICNIAGKRMVAMPSQAVDVAWHEFILFTRQYERFCQKGLGRFLHHTPAEAMATPTAAQKGIKTCWRIACLLEGLSPTNPAYLPRLFALDKELEIADGFHYSLNCKGQGRDSYCASHIGCGSCAGGCSGSTDSGCSGGCGGGD